MEEDICSSILALFQERTDFLRKIIDRVWPTGYCQYIAQIKFAQNIDNIQLATHGQ